MNITVDIPNKQLIVQLTDQEFAGMNAFGTGPIIELQTYAQNFFANKLAEFEQAQRDEINVMLMTANAAKMSEVLLLLDPPPPPAPEPVPEPVPAPPVVVMPEPPVPTPEPVVEPIAELVPEPVPVVEPVIEPVVEPVVILEGGS